MVVFYRIMERFVPTPFYLSTVPGIHFICEKLRGQL